MIPTGIRLERRAVGRAHAYLPVLFRPGIAVEAVLHPFTDKTAAEAYVETVLTIITPPWPTVSDKPLYSILEDAIDYGGHSETCGCSETTKETTWPITLTITQADVRRLLGLLDKDVRAQATKAQDDVPF